jgi:NAD(P)-dependent dehydrogenase (short-subunit alcohol dehydrogenase family)
MQIQDRVFIITGAASGLGAATARMAVEAGGHAVLLDMNAEAGQEQAQALGSAARFIQTDVTSEEQARDAIAQACAHFGRVDVLVNCAGVAPAEKLVGKNGAHDLARFRKVIEINLMGSFNMLRLVAERMIQQTPLACGERGVLISTASIAAFDGQVGQAAYAASKGGVVSLTLPLARELARSAIRVMTIAPGIMETPMLLGMPQEVQDSLGQSVPFPSRMGKPAEFAGLVRHICENGYLNGEVIRLDGAIRMNAR